MAAKTSASFFSFFLFLSSYSILKKHETTIKYYILLQKFLKNVYQACIGQKQQLESNQPTLLPSIKLLKLGYFNPLAPSTD